MLNVSSLPLLFKVIAMQPHSSHCDTKLNSPRWSILFWTQCFKVNHSFPITLFPRGAHVPFCTSSLSHDRQSCSDGSVPFPLLEATGSGPSIISALLGVKGKVASFSRLLGQQAHWSIRQLPGHLRLCPSVPASSSVHNWPTFIILLCAVTRA